MWGNMLGVKIGKIVLEETDSTNNYAKTNITNISDKTVIIAKRQTSGRGRLNRVWVDLGENNLFLSIVLKPSDTYSEIYSNLTQYLSVALCKVLETYGLKAQIKWPNDVLINNKKIAGIIAETIMNGAHLKGIILGLGVNLNADQESIMNIPNKIVTALNIEINQPVDISDFTNKILEEFFKNYEKFLQNGFIEIKNDYVTRNSFLNKEITIQNLNKIEKGIAKKINNKGELILSTKDNQEKTFTIGDIIC